MAGFRGLVENYGTKWLLVGSTDKMIFVPRNADKGVGRGAQQEDAEREAHGFLQERVQYLVSWGRDDEEDDTAKMKMLKLDRRLGPSFVRHSLLPESSQGDLHLVVARAPGSKKQVVSRGESAGSKKAHITRHPTIRPWPCTSCLSLAVGSKTIMKMSILTIKKKACLLLLMAARSCSSFLAPPDNCGASCRSRCDRASKAAYGGGRCIESSRHSPSALGKRRSHLRITPVEQLNFETGEVINSFPSVTEAARALGIPRNRVSDVLSDGVKSGSGFFWRRSGDDAMPPARTYGGIPIEQVDVETGKVINVFPSSAEAARSLGIRTKSISRVVVFQYSLA